MVIDLREKRIGGGRNIHVRKKHQLVAFRRHPNRGIEPTTFVVCRTMLQPTEPTGQGFRV